MWEKLKRTVCLNNPFTLNISFMYTQSSKHLLKHFGKCNRLTDIDHPKLCTFTSNLSQHLWSYFYVVYKVQNLTLSRWQLPNQTFYMVSAFQIRSFHICMFVCSVPQYSLCKYRLTCVGKKKSTTYVITSAIHSFSSNKVYKVQILPRWLFISFLHR